MSAAKKQKVDPNVKGHVFTTTLEPSVFSTLGGDVSLCAYTHIGRRGNQEDRMVYCPDLLLGEYAFLGVFDGTVKVWLCGAPCKRSSHCCETLLHAFLRPPFLFG